MGMNQAEDIIEERYELALLRAREIKTEKTVAEKYQDYFHEMAEFVLLIDEVRSMLLDGSFYQKSVEEMAEINRRLYEDILPEHYAPTNHLSRGKSLPPEPTVVLEVTPPIAPAKTAPCQNQ